MQKTKKYFNRLIVIIAVVFTVIAALILIKLFNGANSDADLDSNSSQNIDSYLDSIYNPIDSDGTSTETITEETSDRAHLKKLRKPTAFPVELSEKIISKSVLSVTIHYYYGNDLYLYFEQRALDIPYEIIESETETITKVDINGYEGIMAMYPGETYIVFTWADSVCSYYMYSPVFNSNQLIEIAKSIQEFDDDLKNHPVTEEITPEVNTLNSIITEIYRPSWYPDGIQEEEIISTLGFFIIEYYSGDEYCFCYIQTPIANDDIHVDNDGATLTNITVGELKGVMITYNTDNRINMFWSDDKYIYEILSETLTYEEAIKVAESVN